MEDTEEKLIGFLKSKTREFWEESGQPLLLSQVRPKAIRDKNDSLSVLGDEKLKAFVKRTERSGTYKVVEHPSQKAKVGLIPDDKEFSYEIVKPQRESARTDNKKIEKDERANIVLSFLRELSKLPDEDLDKVIIPIRILSRLLG